jgi:alcohol dehydrogenase class IV
MSADILIPPIIKIGSGAFLEVPSIVSRLNCRRPLIVTDRFIVGQGLPNKLAVRLREAGLESGLFSETVPDPTDQVVDAGVRAFKDGNHDSLISVGGGSPIDTAKAIGMLVANGGTARDYKVPNPIPNSGPPHIAIPTTAGTGSEVTRFTIITDSARDEKMLISGISLLPSAAVVDYELTLSMPPRLTADTGTDALTHAIEAYVSRKANKFTDSIALAAMKTIWTELPRAYHEPQNREAREAMMQAATLAGIAFSNSSVALVHGMSRPIGAFFHVAHGLSNAMLLPAVTAFSASAGTQRYADCARALGITSPSDSDAQATTTLVRAIFERNAELQVPSPRKYGIPEKQFFDLIPTMATQALASGSPQNNPRVPTPGEIADLYREAWA